MNCAGVPLEATATFTTKLLSSEIGCVASSVAVNEVRGTRFSSCVDEIVICVCTVFLETTTTHLTRCKVLIVVGSVTSMSKMIFGIVGTRISLGIEVSWRDVFASFRGGGGKDGLSTTTRAAHGGGGKGGCVEDGIAGDVSVIVENGHIYTRLSVTVLGSVVRVLANSCISASASTAHFRSGKIGVVVSITNRFIIHI